MKGISAQVNANMAAPELYMRAASLCDGLRNGWRIVETTADYYHCSKRHHGSNVLSIEHVPSDFIYVEDCIGCIHTCQQAANISVIADESMAAMTTILAPT
jgi:hypothetical protein